MKKGKFHFLYRSLVLLLWANFSAYANSLSIGQKIRLLLPSGEALEIVIHSMKNKDNDFLYLGSVKGESSLFEANIKEGVFSGRLLFPERQESFSISQSSSANFEAIESSSEFCAKQSPSFIPPVVAGGPPAVTLPIGVNVRELQSNPGAKGVVYLHFEGATMPSNSYWSDAYNSGVAFSVAAATLSSQAIYNLWMAMAEDFAPFQLNITTDSTIYNAKTLGNRFRLLVTPTSDKFIHLSNTGVAGVKSYAWDVDAFCFPSGFPWETDATYLSEVCSHEIGHVMGLTHDGNDTTLYYLGHGSSTVQTNLWGTIMGSSYTTEVSQWSKGEYVKANNTEDDLHIISSNNFGYREDDHGDDIANATILTHDTSGMIFSNNTGIIAKNTDLDLFSFETSGGEINLQIKPATYKPNLKVQVELLDSEGSLISVHAKANEEQDASIITVLEEGSYYLKVDGIGYLSVDSGYSDYGSLGSYTLEGNYPVAKQISSSISSSILSSSLSISSSSEGPTGLFYQIDKVNSEFSFQHEGNLTVEVYSLTGEKAAVTLMQRANETKLSFEHLATGVWFVKAKNGNQIQVHKIILP